MKLPFLALLLLLGACAADMPGAVGRYETISAEEAWEMMEEDHILLDVRTEQEYLEERIAGAILLPDTEIAERAAEILPDQSQTILVYCRSGRRSAEAASILAGLGYTAVYDFGGIIRWPHGTVSGAPEAP